MKKRILEIIKNAEKSAGFFPLPAPTGAGKTTIATQEMWETVTESGASPRFFWIAPQNKDIEEVYEKLCEYNKRDGKPFKNIDEAVILVRSGLNQMLVSLDSAKEKMPAYIRKTKEFTELEKDCRTFKSFKERAEKMVLVADMAQYEKMLEGNLKESEAAFRKRVKEMLNDDIRGRDDHMSSGKIAYLKKTAIKTEDEWKWLPLLWPAALIDEKKIVLMNMASFLSFIDPVVDIGFRPITSDKLNDAVVFIDEFDAMKSLHLNHIIGGRRDSKLLSECKMISTYLFEENSTLSDYTHSCMSKKTKVAYEELQENGKKLKKRYETGRNFKCLEKELNEPVFLYGIGPGTLKPYVRDGKYLTIYKPYKDKDREKAADLGYADEEFDNECNYILLSEKKPSETNNPFTLMNDMASFLTQFKFLMCSIARERNSVSSIINDKLTRKGADAFGKRGFDYHLKQVLNEFNFPEEFTNELFDECKAIRSVGEGLRGNAEYRFDISMCRSGLRCHVISSVDEDVHFDMIRIPRTPEKELMTLCAKAKVIGLSATCLNKSVLANYSYDFLARMLGEKLDFPDNAYINRIKNQYKKRNAKYADININVDAIEDVDANSELEKWKQVFKNKTIAKDCYSRVGESLVSASNAKYCVDRYIRFAKVYRNALLADNNISTLAMFSASASSISSTFNFETLELIADLVCKDENIEKSDSRYMQVVSVYGQDAMKTLRSANDDIYYGKRTFVVTSYGTLGKAVNPQHPIPKFYKKNRDYVETGSQKNIDAQGRECMDYTGLYLDRRTNIITNLYSGAENIGYDEALASAYETSYLFDAMEIDYITYAKAIRKALFLWKDAESYGYVASNGEKKDVRYTSLSVRESAIRDLQQGTGRICRTSVKGKTINLWIDKNIVPLFAMSEEEKDSLFIMPELEAIIDWCSEGCVIPVIEEADCVEKAITTCHLANKQVDRIAGSDKEWNEAIERDYIYAVETALANPVIKTEKASSIISTLYILSPEKADRYYYKGDFAEKNFEISFEEKDGFKEVSAKAAGLTTMLKTPGFKEYLESNNVASSWGKGIRLMTPAYFEKIYVPELERTFSEFQMI